MQRAFVIKGATTDGESLGALNHFLRGGGKVVATCPMPSSSAASINDSLPTCLVVVEFED